MKKVKETDATMPPLSVERGKYFRPGEIVTAERLNELIDAIDSLEERVKQLEKALK